jgi:hypothetical protein
LHGLNFTRRTQLLCCRAGSGRLAGQLLRDA